MLKPLQNTRRTDQSAVGRCDARDGYMTITEKYRLTISSRHKPVGLAVYRLAANLVAVAPLISPGGASALSRPHTAGTPA